MKLVCGNSETGKKNIMEFYLEVENLLDKTGRAHLTWMTVKTEPVLAVNLFQSLPTLKSMFISTQVKN